MSDPVSLLGTAYRDLSAVLSSLTVEEEFEEIVRQIVVRLNLFIGRGEQRGRHCLVPSWGVITARNSIQRRVRRGGGTRKMVAVLD